MRTGEATRSPTNPLLARSSRSSSPRRRKSTPAASAARDKLSPCAAETWTCTPFRRHLRRPADVLRSHVAPDAHPELFDRHGTPWLPLGCFLIRSGKRLVLIDAGLGPEIQDGMHLLVGGQLLTGLRALGVGTSEVTDVVCSHLHADHVGWLFDLEANPIFPLTGEGALVSAASNHRPRLLAHLDPRWLVASSCRGGRRSSHLRLSEAPRGYRLDQIGRRRWPWTGGYG